MLLQLMSVVGALMVLAAYGLNQGGGLARTACRLPDTQHRRFSDAGCGGHCGPAGRIYFVGVRVGRSRPSRSGEGPPFKTAALAAEADEQ